MEKTVLAAYAETDVKYNDVLSAYKHTKPVELFLEDQGGGLPSQPYSDPPKTRTIRVDGTEFNDAYYLATNVSGTLTMQDSYYNNIIRLFARGSWHVAEVVSEEGSQAEAN